MHGFPFGCPSVVMEKNIYIYVFVKETQDLVFPLGHSVAVTLESCYFFALSFIRYKIRAV